MATTTTVDRIGRVVIPKESRDQFGLGPGSPVTVDDSKDGILLKPGAPPPLAVKGGVLVFSGEAAAEVGGLAGRLREERIRRFLPRRRR